MQNGNRKGIAQWSKTYAGKKFYTSILFLALPIILLVTFTFIPALDMVIFSFQNRDPYGTNPTYAGFSNYVTIFTDKDYLEELKSGPLFAEDKIKLRLADGKIYNALGDYQYADNKVDRSTNSIAVYADFPNASKALVANAYVDVLVEKNYRNVVLVSKKIVTLDADGDYVYLVNGNKLQKSKVVILGEKGGDYVLQNNFKAGDYLVLDKVSPQIASTKIKINVVGKTSAGEKA